MLADALIALALERGYENLTIKAVTDYAGVGYNTFYRHYQSLDNLLIHILTAGLQKINELAIQFDTPHGETVAMYTYIKEHPDVMRVYVNLPWEHPARQAIVRQAKEILSVRYQQKDTSSAPLDVSIDHLLKGANDLVAWYLDNIDDYTPEQVADIHDELINNALEHLALDLSDDWMQKRHQFL